MEYRRLKHRETWHFMPACQHWRRMDRFPGTYLSVELEDRRPSYGELCNECLGKERKQRRDR